MVQAEAKVCRFCGRQLPPAPKDNSGAVGAIGCVVLIAALVGIGALGRAVGIWESYESPPSAASEEWQGYSALVSFDFDCKFQGYPAPESPVAVLGLACSDLAAFRDEVCRGHEWRICDPNAD